MPRPRSSYSRTSAFRWKKLIDLAVERLNNEEIPNKDFYISPEAFKGCTIESAHLQVNDALRYIIEHWQDLYNLAPAQFQAKDVNGQDIIKYPADVYKDLRLKMCFSSLPNGLGVKYKPVVNPKLYEFKLEQGLKSNWLEEFQNWLTINDLNNPNYRAFTKSEIILKDDDMEYIRNAIGANPDIECELTNNSIILIRK